MLPEGFEPDENGDFEGISAWAMVDANLTASSLTQAREWDVPCIAAALQAAYAQGRASMERQVYHIRVGSPDWVPTSQELSDIVQSFVDASSIDEGMTGYVATNPWVTAYVQKLAITEGTKFEASADDPSNLVIIESPYKGDFEANLEYARECLFDSLSRGESPFASHLLYTQVGVPNDGDSAERQRGIDAGLRWGEVADKTVVYVDLGISEGMKYGIKAAEQAGRPVEYRTIRNNK